MLIRIYFSDDKQIDWNVPAPEAINFGDVLDAICHASNDQLIVSSFEFTDEEEDRITVKNEDDLQSMIQYCQGQGSERIVIYPKLCRKPGKRNKFGLKVAIAQPKTALPQNVSQIGAENSRTDQRNPTTLSHSDQMQPNSTDMQFSQLPGLSNVSFTYLETLGNGNSGIVYKVVHNASRIEMAIKSIAIDLTGQEQDRIKSELKILNECNNSQQMIDFYGAFLHENRVFLCMEFMDGGSLDRYGKIPELVLRRVTHRVVSGLKFLWGKRIMHRDVKPSNMLVNTKGQVKLCDFGVSRQLVNSIAQTYIGTNAYMAPERVRGADYTIHSDIWSLGLSICEMATGMYPYPELDSKIKGSRGVIPMEVLQCIVNAAPPQLPSHEFSPAIVDFVSGCLQKDAKFRPSPDVLSQHVFLQINDILDHEDSVIAQWVAERIVLALAKK